MEYSSEDLVVMGLGLVAVAAFIGYYLVKLRKYGESRWGKILWGCFAVSAAVTAVNLIILREVKLDVNSYIGCVVLGLSVGESVFMVKVVRRYSELSKICSLDNESNVNPRRRNVCVDGERK